MATWYGDQFTKTRDGTREFVDVGKWQGRIRASIDHKALTTSVVNNDIVYVAKLPSHAVLLPASKIYWDVLEDSNDDGNVSFGDSQDPNGLVDAVDTSVAASSCSAMAAVAIEKYGKPLWELLGYTVDPGRQIDLYCTIGGLAAGPLAAAGDLTVVLLYVID